MSDEIMKVLPPRTAGPTRGCLQMNVKTIRWFIDSPGPITVGVSWWGDSSKCLFFPSENHEAAPNKKNRSYVFNICSSKEQFHIYLQYHKRLKFFIWRHKEYIGCGVLQNLSQLYENQHFDDFIEIYNGHSRIVADLHVCFNLTFFFPNVPRSIILRTKSVDNDTHPRNAISCHAGVGVKRDRFLMKSDLEPRDPILSRLDPSEQLLQILRKETNTPSVLDVSEFWTDESDIERIPSTPSSESSGNNLKNFESKSSTQQLLEYLKGVNMTEGDQRAAIEILKSISPSSSLSSFVEASAISERDKDQLPREALPLRHSISMPRVRSSRASFSEQKSLERSLSASKLSNSINKKAPSTSPLKNLFQNPERTKPDAGDQTKMKFYRISMDRIIFNSDGLRKLHGSGTINGHQENNCPRGNYIIQYKVSKVDPKFPLEKAEPIRHVSRRVLANGVIFGENDVYKIKDMRSDDVITSFKISCQFLNQRLPVLLGETESLVVRESSKNTLYIKSLNGLTIGKLDVQIDVADCVKNLPPPETFSGRCEKEIEELIARSSLETLKARTDHSKYLALKAQLRNFSCHEKLRNVPSAQYSTYLDLHVTSSRNFSDSAVAQETDSTCNYSLPTELISDFSSDVTETCLGSERRIRSEKLVSDLVNSKDNARVTKSNRQRRKNTLTSESSTDNARIEKKSKCATPQKYDVITHELNVKVNNLANCGISVVSYVFPAGIANETGEVVLKWPATTIFTNLNQSFFISLPLGITLRKFMKRCGKKSISFYFKFPNQKQTIAKAVLDLDQIAFLEDIYKLSADKSPVTKVFTLPLEVTSDLSCTYAEINIEYFNGIKKSSSTNVKEESVVNTDILEEPSNLRSERNVSLNDSCATNVSFSRTISNMDEENLKKAETSKAPVTIQLLDTTFSICENESTQGPQYEKKSAENCKESNLGFTDKPSFFSGYQEISDSPYYRNDHLSTILESSELSKNNLSPKLIDCPDTSYSRNSFENLSQDFTNLSLKASDDSKIQKCSSEKNDVITDNSKPAVNLTRNSISPNSKHSDKPPCNTEFLIPSLNITPINEEDLSDCMVEFEKLNPNVESKHRSQSNNVSPNCTNHSLSVRKSPLSRNTVQTKFVNIPSKINLLANHEEDLSDCAIEFERLNPQVPSMCRLQASHVSTNCLNHSSNVRKLPPSPNQGQEFFKSVVPKSNLAYSEDFKPDQEELVSSSNLATKGGEYLDSYDSPKWSSFNIGPVPSDHENDAVPKYSPLDSARVAADNGPGKTSTADEGFMSTTAIGLDSCRSASDDTLETIDQNGCRRNSDSGYLGISVRDPFEQSMGGSSKSRFYSEPNISQKQRLIPLIDDFGVPAKRVSQDKCFLARIGIVRSINLPTIKLKGGDKQQTKPTTYVTFKDSFDRLHCSSTVVKTLTPEYDSRHKAWFATELLTNTEERLVFQVWCKRYQNEWAGPDCDRDRCLGYVYCNLSVLVYDFPYAGGWHNIVSLSGQINGQVQILVKPLQDISFVKNIECEELFHTQSNLMNYLQPHNYFSSSVCSNLNDGITTKQLLRKNIDELEEAIRSMQIAHKIRQMKCEESISNGNQHQSKPAEEYSTVSDPINTETETHAARLNNSHPRQSRDLLQNCPSHNSNTKSAAKKMIRKYFRSFRKKSKKNKHSVPADNESNINPASNSCAEMIDSNSVDGTKEIERDLLESNATPLISQKGNDRPSDDDLFKNCKKSPSVFPRRFSFKLKKSENKNKTYQNALLQSLPLYEKNVEKKTDKLEPSKNCSTPNRNFYINKANTLYHSL